MVVLTVVYLYNRTPYSKLNYKTPYEAKFGCQPDISYIKTFGSLVYFKRKPVIKLNKLDQRGILGILVGYGINSVNYYIWDLENSRPIWVRDLKILENIFLSLKDPINYKYNTLLRLKVFGGNNTISIELLDNYNTTTGSVDTNNLRLQDIGSIYNDQNSAINNNNNNSTISILGSSVDILDPDHNNSISGDSSHTTDNLPKRLTPS